MNLFKKIIPKPIIPLLIFIIILSILRVFIWGRLGALYILWNVFLAFIPFIISLILIEFIYEKKLTKAFLLIGIFLWILFIPNAHYIITDLIHVGEVRQVPDIYDAFLLFSGALIGLFFGLYSLSHMEQIIKARFSNKIASIAMPIIFLLIGFGIYIGRFMRFNSWDFFSNYSTIFRSFNEIFLNKYNYIGVFVYTILFASFVYVSYKSWKYLKVE